ncbi:MAG: hypothetical protein JST82_00105 [Bacteroidetes bacterium]|nr:hypothetical protein [Bacteroidota bacterium]
MKRILPVILSMTTTIVLSSCERKYTCTCVYPNAAAGTTKTEIRAYSRSDAKETCSNMNTGAKLNGGACAL